MEALTIRQKREQHIADKIVNKFRLFLFDFDKSSLTEKNKKVMNLIAKEIKPTSSVTVYGFADRTGEAKHNLELSTDRANAVADYIRAHAKPAAIESEGKGSEQTMFDNTSPEGRFFCRTVCSNQTPVEDGN